ncbi:MAG: hypothetical protein FD180_4345 [Planctomycetota bacterium]|nr:MAG: hypothetical protein FD180_4345 [Planctomycetota bacterium]
MPDPIKHEPDASLRAVALFLGVSYVSVHRLVKRGELPAYRLGRVFRVSMRALRDWRERRIAAGWTPYRKRAPGERGGRGEHNQ